MAEEDQNDVWPPPPTNRVVDQPPTDGPPQTLGLIAMACSGLGVTGFFLVHTLPITLRPLPGLGALLLVLLGIALSLVARRSKSGRLALLATPAFLCCYFLYLLLGQYVHIPF